MASNKPRMLENLNNVEAHATDHMVALSMAISAKRIADALVSAVATLEETNKILEKIWSDMPGGQ